MTITPQGQLYLCKTPLENDYKNQLTFSSANDQLTYFNSTIKHTFDNYTYIKKDNVLQVGKNIDEIIDCNYLFYKNTGFTNKWYFCFITNMEYVNENCTRITFETDCYQTWLFQINYKQCFVEREHVNDDTIGLHTVPENLETGEYIMVNDYTKNSTPFQTMFYIMCAVIDPFVKVNNKFSKTGGDRYDGVYSGYDYFYFKNASDLSNKLLEIDNAGQSDSVLSIFMYPDELLNLSPYDNNSDYGYVTPSGSPKTYTLANITLPQSLGQNKSYTPKNNKLLTYPFTFLQISNNAGTINNIEYENISEIDSSAELDMVGQINPGGQIICYLEKAKNFQSSPSTIYTPLILNVAKLPVCTWNSDVYINWLTQNGINIAGDVLSIGKDVINPSFENTTNILSIASKYYQHSLAPNTVKGQANNNTPLLSLGQLEPRAYQISIKEEYAKIIDNIFSMYGYKINEVKIPNITGRSNWNYVKTINCNFDGDIPQTDLNIIRGMFNNGVTLWHNPSTIYNYSNSNNII